MNQIDTRGYSCPEPVLMTKQALAKSGVPLSVLADSGAPLQNITRLAQNAGHKVECKASGDSFELRIT